jgi:hypothetical protein
VAASSRLSLVISSVTYVPVHDDINVVAWGFDCCITAMVDFCGGADAGRTQLIVPVGVEPHRTDRMALLVEVGNEI